MNALFENGRYTVAGAKKYGFQKGNTLGHLTAGANNPHWKGGIKINKSHGNTYRMIRIKPGYYRQEHRIVMEEYLGRKLLRNEAVHHIDGNGLNNKIENLEICTWTEHKRKHLGSYIYGDKFKCKCGSDKKHFAKGMCSTCYARERARKLHPNWRKMRNI